LLEVSSVSPVEAEEVAGWPSYGNDPGGSRYSPLGEIDASNVADLEVAWTYRTGDYARARPELGKTAFQATPILDEGTLYFCSPASRVFALDAETGAERWVFDGRVELDDAIWTKTCRGVALWRADADADNAADAADADQVDDATGRAPAPCRRRVFLGSLDAGLYALDADTGVPCHEFGNAGRVDLEVGLGDIRPGEMYMTSPPLVIGDVVVTGALIGDNRRVDPPGGVVRGWDVRSGKLRWAFDPVPPGTPPLAPDEDGSPRYHRGTPNAWSILSADPARNLVFIPFGNPSPDFFGGHRKNFDHYGSSVVALRGDSGEVVWHFQTVHHDLWDYDVASQPTLIEVQKDGLPRAAVAQATKMGHIFLLDRETGEPIHPVEERAVPQTTVPGEVSSPTQPFPTFPPPLLPERLGPEDAFGFTPWDRNACADKIASLRNEGIFTPPSLEGSLQYPGTAGGANWGGVAFDPERRLLVLNLNNIAQVHTLIPRAAMPDATPDNRPKGYSLQEGTPYLVKHDVLISPFGVPCNPPPWGSLLALSLDTGEKLWEVPFGTVRDMTPIPIPWNLGMPSMGGPIVTASGLVFIGAAMDNYIRAYDVMTGKERWRQRLPAGAQATPMTYRVRPDGRQYIVIAAGGHSTLGTELGDYVIAYALPGGPGGNVGSD